MKGWDLKEGEILKKDLNNEEMIDLFYNFFQKKTKMNNLYKLFLLKSVLEYSELQKENIFKEINYNFGKNYWDFIINNREINTTMFNGYSTKSAQEITVMNLKKKILLEFLKNFEKIPLVLKNHYLNETKINIKVNVIGAIYGDFKGTIYSFNKKENTIILNENLRKFMFKNKKILFELIDYRMIEFLKLVNKKSDLKDLNILKKYSRNIEDDFYKNIDLMFNKLKTNKEESALDMAKKNNDLIMELLKKFE